jgi:hypothetical protein
MKNRIYFLTLLASTLFLAVACGMKYVSPESFNELETKRKLALEQQLTEQFAAIGKKYSSLTYGESLTVKPYSYMRLDSLFEVKYNLQQQNRSSKEIDPLIEQQKIALLADSTEVLYMETNWFELEQDTVLEYVIARCFLNNRNTLRRMDVVDDFVTEKINQMWARKYMKEDWFTRNIGITPEEDANFYTLMKTYEASLNDAQKTTFLNRVFEVMKLSNELGSINAKEICSKLALEDVKTIHPNLDLQNYTTGFQKMMDASNRLVGYRIKFIQKANNQEAFSINYSVYYQVDRGE